MKRSALLLMLLSSSALADPPLCSVPWSTKNPDMVGVCSTDPAAGAGYIAVPPGIPDNFDLGFEIKSENTGRLSLGLRTKPGDTAQAIAAAFCAQIDGHPTLREGNVGCQLQGSIVGVTHHADNNLTIVPHDGYLQIQQGSLALDAGGILVCNRVPPGIVPRAGSSVCQIIAGGASSETPGRATVQYGMMQTRVISSDIHNIAGAWEVYTAAPDGLGNPIINLAGTFMFGGFYAEKLFLKGRQICANPPPSNSLYLSTTGSCP